MALIVGAALVSFAVLAATGHVSGQTGPAVSSVEPFNLGSFAIEGRPIVSIMLPDALVGEVVTREELLEQALGYSAAVSSRAVDSLVVSLRKKIEKDPHNPRHLLTAHGAGYKLAE